MGAGYVAVWLVWRWWLGRGWGLRGIGPVLAGKLAGAWAFALRARGEGVDVPMLAPARSRCRRCVRGGWLSVGLLGSDAWGYALIMVGGFWVGVALRVWRWG